MSFDNIETAFVQEYANTVQMLSQRKGKLRDKVMIQPVTGERHYFEQYEKDDVIETVTTRHADIKFTDTNFRRVAVDLADYQAANIVGGFDKIRMLVDPLAPVVQAQAMKFARKVDELIINSIYADIKTGKTGSTTEAPQTAIAVNSWAFGSGSGDAPMTISKIIEAKELFDAADVDDMDRVLVMDPLNYNKLLATAEATSIDFVSSRSLESGKLPNLLGFDLIQHSGIGVDGSGYKRCFAFQKSGVALAVGQDIKADISQRKDKEGLPYQAYFSMSMAATRLEKAKTVEIKCRAS